MTSLEELARCAYCPRLCRHVCPPLHAESRETVSPTSLLTLLMLERQGALPGDPALAEIVGHCVMCGRCTEACLHEAAPWEVLRQARGRLGTARVVGAESAALWEPAPFGAVGAGADRWWLLGGLVGLDAETVRRRLAADAERRWSFPGGSCPVDLYRVWTLGDEPAWRNYLEQLRSLLAAEHPQGIAWADPHEGKAVRAALDEIGYKGELGYAPHLLALVEAERCGCSDLTEVDGCCGAAGGYPRVEPAAAARLAERFTAPAGSALPGLCLAHLAVAGRTEYRSDWSDA